MIPKGDVISCFTGVGMLDRAAENEGWRTIATAEIDPWCRDILGKRFPDAVHLKDVRDINVWPMLDREFDGRDRPGENGRKVMVTGGFPCQDTGSSGTGLGINGSRSGLVREQLRIIKEFRPDYALFENAPQLTGRGLNVILAELVKMRYHVRWECLPAATFDAPHLRDRCWIMARKAERPFKRDRVIEEIGDFVMAPELIPAKLPRSGMTRYSALYETTPLATRRAARLNAETVHGTLLPTPTKSDGTGGPGTTPKRTGGKNLRTVAAEITGNGRLDPGYIEWMMGLPIGWTDPHDHRTSEQYPAPLGWRAHTLTHPQMTTSVKNVPHRSKRIQALGNGCVPAVASAAIDLLTQD